VNTSGEGAKRVRIPARAGVWYKGNEPALAAQVDDLIERAPARAAPGHLIALIAPHAGYTFSGIPAAVGFKLLQGSRYTRVVLLGVPHTAPLSGCSVPDFTHYRTPLGEVPLDRKACAALLESPVFTRYTQAHTMEHSIEAQLPFLQRMLEDFSIVPILVGELTDRERTKAAQALQGLLDDDTLTVVSSDFTHFGASFGYLPFQENVKANLDELDHGAVAHILKLDARGFTDYVKRTRATICGRSAIALLLEVLRPLGDVEATELAYTTSGHLSGDWSHCVSYCTIAFTRPAAAGVSPVCGEEHSPEVDGTGRADARVQRGAAGADVQEAGAADTMALDHLAPAEAPPEEAPGLQPTGPTFLTPEEQRFCLELARRALAHYFRTHEHLQVDSSELTGNLKGHHGCFVTLKKHGQLRGCIGRIVGDTPLYRTIVEYAVHAAVDDPRFRPVTEPELGELEIEISVMTPLERVKDVNEIMVGRDGLLIKRGYNQGLLLPQVATDYGWDRETFLTNTCRKAGLPVDAWKDPRTEIHKFSAQVFGEAG